MGFERECNGQRKKLDTIFDQCTFPYVCDIHIRIFRNDFIEISWKLVSTKVEYNSVSHNNEKLSRDIDLTSHNNEKRSFNNAL